MRKMICILLAFALMLLCGCAGQTEPTQPPVQTEPNTTAAATEPELNENALSAEELAEFQALFDNTEQQYLRTVTSCYDDPARIDLYQMFYGGFGDENISEEEWKFLEGVWTESQLSWDVSRIPEEKMDEILREYLGIGLDETDCIGLDGFAYLESAGCYFHTSGDTNRIPIMIQAGSYTQDGKAELVYDREGELFVVTMVQVEGRWIVCKNLPLNNQ